MWYVDSIPSTHTAILTSGILSLTECALEIQKLSIVAHFLLCQFMCGYLENIFIIMLLFYHILDMS